VSGEGEFCILGERTFNSIFQSFTTSNQAVGVKAFLALHTYFSTLIQLRVSFNYQVQLTSRNEARNTNANV